MLLSWYYYDYWVVKIDNVGNKIWDKTYGSSNAEYLYSMIATNDNCYVLVGSTDSSGNGNVTTETHGSCDYWIVKLNNNGESN